MENKVEEIEIKSVVEYITEVNKLLKKSKFNPNTHTAFFRGHANKDWKLEPGLLRNDGYIENEHLMYRTIVAKHTSEFSTCTSALDYLVKMQHYGLPTRLLDLTTNPLVALYFACEHQVYSRSNKETGEIIVLSIPTYSIKHYDSDTISILANIAKCKEEEIRINMNFDKWMTTDFHNGFVFKQDKEYEEYRESFNALGEIKLLLHQISLEKNHFLPIIDPKDLSQVCVVHVKQDNQRIKNQMGAFLLFGLGISTEKHTCILSKKGNIQMPKEWNLTQSTRLVIPGDCKKGIIEELSRLGISKSFVYPELGILSEELKKQYEK